jgi:hypothetical protein
VEISNKSDVKGIFKNVISDILVLDEHLGSEKIIVENSSCHGDA